MPFWRILGAFVGGVLLGIIFSDPQKLPTGVGICIFFISFVVMVREVVKRHTSSPDRQKNEEEG